jgi:alkylation response protein AidB-like acyl-CoA dehydrogenase
VGDDLELTAEAAQPLEFANALDTFVVTRDLSALIAELPTLSVGIPLPGSGNTLRRFTLLASAAAADVTAARVIEPHLDAVAILNEASGESFSSEVDRGLSLGVFAAEAPGIRLCAERSDGEWSLSGVKPWCSLGTLLDSALVTAFTSNSERRLFRVPLQTRHVQSNGGNWVSRGLSDVPSGPLVFDHAPALPIGDDGWYLRRPGFAWGGIGVAACWWGACLPLIDAILVAGRRKSDDPLTRSRVGRLYRLAQSSRFALERAAKKIDYGPRNSADENIRAHTVRGLVIDLVDETLDTVRDLCGPAVLGFDDSIASRHADLQMYASQYHRGRDDSSLGRDVLATNLPW